MGVVDRFEVNRPRLFVGDCVYVRSVWWEYLHIVFPLPNFAGERLPLVVALVHHFEMSCLRGPRQQLFPALLLFPGQDMCIKPPHVCSHPLQGARRVVGLFVVVAPSSAFGVQEYHGVEFRDVVVTGHVQKRPSYSSFFVFWDGEDGFDLYALGSEGPVDGVAKEHDGLTPMGDLRLFLTQCEAHGSSVPFDGAFHVSGLLFSPVDEDDNVSSVPDVSPFCVMPSIIDRGLSHGLLQSCEWV